MRYQAALFTDILILSIPCVGSPSGPLLLKSGCLPSCAIHRQIISSITAEAAYNTRQLNLRKY